MKESGQCSWPSFRQLQLFTGQLARFICRYLEMPVLEELVSIVSLARTPEWKVLGERVFLNFDLEKFERMIALECRRIRLELTRLD